MNTNEMAKVSETELDDESLPREAPLRSNTEVRNPAKVLETPRKTPSRWRLWTAGTVALIAVALAVGFVIQLSTRNHPTSSSASSQRSSSRQSNATNTAPTSPLSSVPHSILVGPSMPPTTTTTPPTIKPTSHPRFVPTQRPSRTPSRSPTVTPSMIPSASPTGRDRVTTFCAIGDVPYTAQQAVELQTQILELPSDAEFLVHVGDLREEKTHAVCVEEDYASVSAILRRSPVPVFVLLGDNDWNDCLNPVDGLAFWMSYFLYFESRYWNHTFDVIRMPGRPESFSFVHRGTLFVGLNIVGGAILDITAWTDRLTTEVHWTMDLIRNYTAAASLTAAGAVGRVVLLGHADPTSNHNAFFLPLQAFIRDELHNQLPILYLHGDGHYWLDQPNYLQQPSFRRIMVRGMTYNPPLKVMVHANGAAATTLEAFVYDRRLP